MTKVVAVRDVPFPQNTDYKGIIILTDEGGLTNRENMIDPLRKTWLSDCLWGKYGESDDQ